MTSIIGTGERDGEVEALRRVTLDATFTGFCTQHRDDVLRILGNLERDRGMVEDVAQEAFFAAHQRWEEIHVYDKPVAWVLKVAIRRLRTKQRRRSREGIVPMQAEEIDGLDGATIAAPCSPHAARDMLSAWIVQLPPRHAEVIALASMRYTDNEIAQILSRTYNTVRSHRAQAMAALRSSAEKDGFSVAAGRRRR